MLFLLCLLNVVIETTSTNSSSSNLNNATSFSNVSNSASDFATGNKDTIHRSTWTIFNMKKEKSWNSSNSYISMKESKELCKKFASMLLSNASSTSPIPTCEQAISRTEQPTETICENSSSHTEIFQSDENLEISIASDDIPEIIKKLSIDSIRTSVSSIFQNMSSLDDSELKCLSQYFTANSINISEYLERSIKETVAVKEKTRILKHFESNIENSIFSSLLANTLQNKTESEIIKNLVESQEDLLLCKMLRISAKKPAMDILSLIPSSIKWVEFPKTMALLVSLFRKDFYFPMKFLDHFSCNLEICNEFVAKLSGRQILYLICKAPKCHIVHKLVSKERFNEILTPLSLSSAPFLQYLQESVSKSIEILYYSLVDKFLLEKDIIKDMKWKTRKCFVLSFINKSVDYKTVEFLKDSNLLQLNDIASLKQNEELQNSIVNVFCYNSQATSDFLLATRKNSNLFKKAISNQNFQHSLHFFSHEKFTISQFQQLDKYLIHNCEIEVNSKEFLSLLKKSVQLNLENLKKCLLNHLSSNINSVDSVELLTLIMTTKYFPQIKNLLSKEQIQKVKRSKFPFIMKFTN